MIDDEESELLLGELSYSKGAGKYLFGSVSCYRPPAHQETFFASIFFVTYLSPFFYLAVMLNSLKYPLGRRDYLKKNTSYVTNSRGSNL